MYNVHEYVCGMYSVLYRSQIQWTVRRTWVQNTYYVMTTYQVILAVAHNAIQHTTAILLFQIHFGFIHISLIVWLLSLESLWFSSSWFYIILALSHNRLYLCLNGFTFFPYFFFVHFMGRTKYYLTFLWDLLEIVLVHLACVVNKTDMRVMCHLNQKST